MCTHASILANTCICVFKLTAVSDMSILLCFSVMWTPAVHHSHRPLEIPALPETENSERSLVLGAVFSSPTPHWWPQAAALRDTRPRPFICFSSELFVLQSLCSLWRKVLPNGNCKQESPLSGFTGKFIQQAIFKYSAYSSRLSLHLKQSL